MNALMLCALLYWQYGIDQICVDGECQNVRGALTYVEGYCYLKLDSTTYTFNVDRYIESEQLLQIHGADFSGFIILRNDYALLIATPHNKRNRERVFKLRFYYDD